MKVTRYQRRTPPRDVRVQIDLSAEEIEKLCRVLDDYWEYGSEYTAHERGFAMELDRAVRDITKHG